MADAKTGLTENTRRIGRALALSRARRDERQLRAVPAGVHDRRESHRRGSSNQVTYAAICCRMGCAWRTAIVTADKLEAIRAGRQHEAERRPELHITTVIHIDGALDAAA
jgi:hypothetical protein